MKAGSLIATAALSVAAAIASAQQYPVKPVRDIVRTTRQPSICPPSTAIV